MTLPQGAVGLKCVISVFPNHTYLLVVCPVCDQSELPWPIPWKSLESDLGCTSRTYFDNVTLTLHNVTLTSQKSCQHNNNGVIAAKQMVLNEYRIY